MNKTLLTLAIMLPGFATMAQLQKADELDNKWDYSDAAVLYERAAASHPDATTYFKLGECYRKMGQYDKALSAYDKVDAKGDFSNADFYLQYGLMLKTTNQYDKAKAEFQKYEKMKPGDSRGKMYENSCDVAVEDHKTDIPLDIRGIDAINTNASEFSPEIFRDELVFTTNQSSAKHNQIDASTGAPYLAVYSAGKTNDSTFQTASILNSTINLQYHDGPVCFSKNGDTMYFTRVNRELKGAARKKGIERSKLYYATMKNGDWGGVTALAFNSDSFSVGHPALSADGRRLYFASDMPGGMGGVDIWYCNRDGGGWSKPVNAGPNVNTPGRDNYPTVDSMGNLYFSSDGYIGFGGLDICVAKYNYGNFEKAQVLKCPLNSCGDDFGMVFIVSGRRGYFSSNRNGGKGNDDIYYFDMGKDLTTDAYVVGYKKPEPVVETPVKKMTEEDYRTPAPYDTTFDSLDIHILFDFDKSDLRADASYKLGRIVAYLKTHTNKMVQINGFTDIKGTDDYNIKLSKRRAKTVEKFLLSNGITENRMLTVGLGSQDLLLKEAVYDEAREQVNRRVQFAWMPMDANTINAPEKPAGKKHKSSQK